MTKECVNNYQIDYIQPKRWFYFFLSSKLVYPDVSLLVSKAVIPGGSPQLAGMLGE